VLAQQPDDAAAAAAATAARATIAVITLLRIQTQAASGRQRRWMNPARGLRPPSCGLPTLVADILW